MPVFRGFGIYLYWSDVTELAMVNYFSVAFSNIKNIELIKNFIEHNCLNHDL
jgi:hypothetical protein